MSVHIETIRETFNAANRSRAMNRITSYLTANDTSSRTLIAQRTERRLRRDAETMLRDFAFVLKMTERIKADILAEKESESIAV